MKILKQQKAITLIALIITIIVMIILLGVTINVAMNGGLIKKAIEAADKTTMESEKEIIIMAAFEAVNSEGVFDYTLLELPEDYSYNNTNQTVTTETGNIFYITDEGEVLTKNPVNEYGFYFNREYVCNNWFDFSVGGDTYSIKFSEDGTVNIHAYESKDLKENQTLHLEDFAGEEYINIQSIEYNKTYSGTGTINSQCSGTVKNNGDLVSNYIISKDYVTYSTKHVKIGNVVFDITGFSDDGKSFVYNGKTFTIR